MPWVPVSQHSGNVLKTEGDDHAKLVLGWQAPAQVSGSPVIGGHTVYSLDGQGGVLYALESERGAVHASLSVGPVSRFATPTLVGKALFVGTLTSGSSGN